MSVDLFSGLSDDRDWSIGAAEDAKKEEALSKVEVWTPQQIQALALATKKEIDANAGLVSKGVANKTISAEDAENFGKFYAEWQKFAVSLAPNAHLKGVTADRLRHWRGLNAQWTHQLSRKAVPAATTVREARMLMIVVSRAEKKPSRWPLLAAAAGVLGLGYWLNRR